MSPLVALCIQSNTVHRRMTIRRRDSIVAAPRKLSPKEVRGKIVEEILNTEKAYVQQLEDIIDVSGVSVVCMFSRARWVQVEWYRTVLYEKS